MMSGQLGFGQISGDWVLRPGVSFGWGRPNGWVSIDSVAEIHLDRGTTDYKLDLTWGAKPAARPQADRTDTDRRHGARPGLCTPCAVSCHTTGPQETDQAGNRRHARTGRRFLDGAQDGGSGLTSEHEKGRSPRTGTGHTDHRPVPLNAYLSIRTTTVTSPTIGSFQTRWTLSFLPALLAQGVGHVELGHVRRVAAGASGGDDRLSTSSA